MVVVVVDAVTVIIFVMSILVIHFAISCCQLQGGQKREPSLPAIWRTRINSQREYASQGE